MNIAILGATSHIAKGLIFNFSKHTDYKVFLFARSTDNVTRFINENNINNNSMVVDFNDFYKFNYDCIINCIGISRTGNISEVIELTEKYDSFIIAYLEKNNECLYINFSSGAVYSDLDKLQENRTTALHEADNKPQNYYSIAKLYSETKHRSLSNFNIVDIRLFAYFSRFIDLNSAYLITEILKSIINKTVLITNSDNIIRDYSHPYDLFSLILKCINKKYLNEVYDTYSKNPISKFELLNFYSKIYGLQYIIDEKLLFNNPTGQKKYYFSNNHKAEEIGFLPKYSSMKAIEIESEFILNNKYI